MHLPRSVNTYTKATRLLIVKFIRLRLDGSAFDPPKIYEKTKFFGNFLALMRDERILQWRLTPFNGSQACPTRVLFGGAFLEALVRPTDPNYGRG